MKTRDKLFQTDFPSFFLQTAMLGIAIIATALPAHADSVTLSCRDEANAVTSTLRIDYSTNTVEELGPSGDAYTNRIAPNATISANAIVWSAELMDTGLANPVPMNWAGNIDRLSGTAWTQWSREPDWIPYTQNFTCIPATQKF